MSNRQFKTLLNQQKFIVFDYGTVNEIPQIDITLSGLCKCNNIFYLKQRDSQNWQPIIQQKKLLHIVANDSSTENYDWYNEWYGQNNINNVKTIGENNLFVWKHNYSDANLNCEFFMSKYIENEISDSSQTSDNSYEPIIQLTYEKIYLPYMIYDQNIVIVDFCGLNNSNNKFFIVCN